MNAEGIVSMAVLLVCTAPILIIGIVQYRSRSPVGFWSGVKPPKKEEVTDIRAYNRKHGIMWILYGLGFMLCFLSGIPFGGEAAAVAAGAECIGGLFVMIVYHKRLDRIYLKKKVKKKGNR